MRKVLVAPAMVVLLAACVTQAQPPARAERFSAEPYAVRPVDFAKFPASFAAQTVPYQSNEPMGTVIVDLSAKFLYLLTAPGQARRYPIGIGVEGRQYRGALSVARRAPWPGWTPTPSMRALAELPSQVPPGPGNPLGARALYLYQHGQDTLLRIHGTSEPWTIGTEASSGCVRMFNEHVIDLYDRVALGAKVIFM